MSLGTGPDLSTRIQNFGLGADAHCTWCCDDGVVFVGTERREIHKKRLVVNEDGSREWKYRVEGSYDEEIWGPCPMCVIGYHTEFPSSSRWPWGAKGFWQGRPARIEKACRCHLQTADRETVRRGLAMLRHAEQEIGVEPERTRLPAFAASTDASAEVASGEGNGSDREAGHHRCPGYGRRDMPWPQSECPACNDEEGGVTL